jgi:hypothetical protein
MPKLVCVVEGHGEVEAIPNLCSRIRDYLAAWEWYVDPDPVRQPRGSLVEMKSGPEHGRAKIDRLPRAIELARRRPQATAVLVICDEDDECAAIWAPSAAELVTRVVAGSAVMAVREYETWLAHNASDLDLLGIGVPDPERHRDAKGIMRKLVPGYKPTTHQLAVTQTLDVQRVRSRSASFDKLVRTLGQVFGTTVLPRPERQVTP